jgi:Glyoxalase-like domain
VTQTATLLVHHLDAVYRRLERSHAVTPFARGENRIACSAMPDRLVQVIVLTEDLDREGDRFRRAGFCVEPGGRHPGRGTENLIVPFAGQYLEILSVVDRARAAASPHGSPVVAALERRGPGLARWSVEPQDIAATAARLGLPVEPRQRSGPDGNSVRWRAVGVNEAWRQPWRCAFLSWDEPTMHPGSGAVSHPNGAVGLGTLEVGVPDIETARAWIGDVDLAGAVQLLPSDAAAADLLLKIRLSDGPLILGPSGLAH